MSKSTIKQKTTPKRDPETRIIAAGRKLFLKHGYSGVTTDMLVREASASKATLYKYFPDKAAILVKVLEREGDTFMVAPDDLPDEREAYLDALKGFGTGLLTLLSKREIRGFEHLVITESRHIPDIAAEFYKATYDRTFENLTRLIGAGLERGWIQSKLTAEQASDALISLWASRLQDRDRFGVKPDGSESPADRVHFGLNLVFPDAYGS
ncbi:TetR/AcrR family transcriptional regulator [uncultured Algimonas sp.]|uniref:TetR/AcrR family transcriptional regulator n=1 Tax=uncultured Algimonas sp. TaxID=1547920 RepID=UPI00263124A1|nr:TetR/AcrR family transcriptional regulator [uncultured Algimonas sp.]